MMRTPKEIMKDIDNMKNPTREVIYKPLMLEIMCNVAITLDNLYKYAKEINDEE